MRYLEHSALNRLSVLLQRLDVGDRVIEGKLELFTTASKLSNEAILGDIINKGLESPKWGCSHPANQALKRGERELMINLISTLNQCFPDYDFSTLTPDDFHHITRLEDAYDNINYNLSFVVEKVFPGFVQELWDAIQDAISLEDVDIYSYDAGCHCDPYTDENCLFSFDYFFHDKKKHRFLFLSCITKSKVCNYSYDEEDDDENGVGEIFKKEPPTSNEDAFDDIESYASSPVS